MKSKRQILKNHTIKYKIKICLLSDKEKRPWCYENALWRIFIGRKVSKELPNEMKELKLKTEWELIGQVEECPGEL